MQIGRKDSIQLRTFEKLGLIRDAWKSRSWLSKLRPKDKLAENLIAEASAESFQETKAVRAALEQKRAEALCHARGILRIL